MVHVHPAQDSLPQPLRAEQGCSEEGSLSQEDPPCLSISVGSGKLKGRLATFPEKEMFSGLASLVTHNKHSERHHRANSEFEVLFHKAYSVIL